LININIQIIKNAAGEKEETSKKIFKL